nr:ductus ejaculatorius peptide 99B isoform X1 [Drosophila bipectinata]
MKNLNLFLVVALALVSMVASQEETGRYYNSSGYVTTERDKWCRLNLGPFYGGMC